MRNRNAFITVETEPSTRDRKAIENEELYRNKIAKHKATYETRLNPRYAEQDLLMEMVANMNQPQPQQPRQNALDQAIYAHQQGRGQSMPMMDGVGSGNGRGQEMRVGDGSGKQVANDVENQDGKSAFQHIADTAGDDNRRVSF